MVDRTDKYLRPRGYYDNKGNLLNVGFDIINGLPAAVNSKVNQTEFDELENDVITHMAETVTEIVSRYVYVDATNGNDASGNGSAATPYKTITYALTKVNKNLAAAIIIRVLPGDYTVEGFITIRGFQGHDLKLTAFDGTNDVSALSEIYKIEGFTSYDTRCLYLTGFHMVHTTGNGYSMFFSNSIARVTACSTIATGSMQSGFGCTEQSFVWITGCKTANQQVVISSNYGAMVYCELWDAGSTGNDVVFNINNSAQIIQGDDTCPVYTHLLTTEGTGGRLYDKSGVQIIKNDLDKNIKTSQILFSTDLSVNQTIVIPIALASRPSWIKISATINGTMVSSEGAWCDNDGETESCIAKNNTGISSAAYDIISLDAGSGNSTQYSVSTVTATTITLTRALAGTVTGTMFASVLCGV